MTTIIVLTHQVRRGHLLRQPLPHRPLIIIQTLAHLCLNGDSLALSQRSRTDLINIMHAYRRCSQLIVKGENCQLILTVHLNGLPGQIV